MDAFIHALVLHYEFLKFRGAWFYLISIRYTEKFSFNELVLVWISQIVCGADTHPMSVDMQADLVQSTEAIFMAPSCQEDMGTVTFHVKENMEMVLVRYDKSDLHYVDQSKRNKSLIKSFLVQQPLEEINCSMKEDLSRKI